MKSIIRLKFFDLSPKEETISKKLFGKIVKCVIAPNHAPKHINCDSEVWSFPEYDTSYLERELFIKDVLKTDHEVIQIVTSDVFIMRDIPSECIRILQRNGKFATPVNQTFMNYQIDDLVDLMHGTTNPPESKSFGSIKLHNAIKAVKAKKPNAIEDLKFLASLVGHSFLRSSLKVFIEGNAKRII